MLKKCLYSSQSFAKFDVQFTNVCTVQYVIRIRIIINNFVFKKLHVFSDHVFQPWIYVATCCFKVHIKHLNPKRRETCVPCVAKILSVERPVFPAWLKSICSPFSLQTKHQKMRKYVKMLDKTWQLGTLLSLSVVACGVTGDGQEQSDHHCWLRTGTEGNPPPTCCCSSPASAVFSFYQASISKH